MMYGIFGIYHKSCLEVCQSLNDLNISYTVYGKEYNQIKRVENKLKVMPVYVIDGLYRAGRLDNLAPGIQIICDSQPALAKSNVSRKLYPGLTLRNALKQALLQAKENRLSKKKKVLKTRSLTLQEVLKSATTYSFLNGIQTALYKITPYTLRKESQKQIISYFYGDTSYTALISKLESSAKLATLLALCKDQQAKALRQACILARKDMSKVEKVAKASGFASFEIVYIIKSHEKAKEED